MSIMKYLISLSSDIVSAIIRRTGIERHILDLALRLIACYRAACAAGTRLIYENICNRRAMCRMASKRLKLAIATTKT